MPRNINLRSHRLRLSASPLGVGLPLLRFSFKQETLWTFGRQGLSPCYCRLLTVIILASDL